MRARLLPAVLMLLAVLLPRAGLAGHTPWDLWGHLNIAVKDLGQFLSPLLDPNQVGCGDPIDLGTGNFTYRELDLVLPGFGPQLAILRTYHSQDGRAAFMGHGWHTLFTATAVQVSDGVEILAALCDDGGARRRFRRLPDGSFAAPPGSGLRLDALPDGGLALGDREGAVRSFDATGRLTAIRDRFGSALKVEWDSRGFPAALTDPAGRQVTVTTGADGRVAALTDHVGRSWRYAYDGEGNLVSATDPAGAVSTYRYDAGHNLTEIVDARGEVVVTNTYEGDRVVRQRQAGYELRLTYEPGRTRVRLPRGGETLFELDPVGRPLRIIDPNGAATSFTWTAAGQPASYTDPNGAVVRWDYDKRGNLVRETDAAGFETRIEWHPELDLPVAITDPNGNTSRFRYDDRGLLTAAIDALGHEHRYAHDGRGLRTEVVDPRGNITRLAYDEAGNLASVTDPLGHTTRFEHDALGNRTAIIDALGRVTRFAYDPLGRLVRLTEPDGAERRFAYDAVGNLTEEVDELGRATRFTYDALSRLTEATDPRGKVTRYAYDANGNLASLRDPLSNQVRYEYDRADRLIRSTAPDGGATTFAYDPAGNLTRVSDALRRVTSYTYDARGQLTAVTDAAGGETRFGYDPNGNNIELIDAKDQTTRFAFDPLDREIAFTDPVGATKRFEYDPNGNLALVVTRKGERIEHVYDAAGRLTEKRLPGGEATRYVWDPVGNLAVVEDSDSRVTVTYGVRREAIAVSTQGAPLQPEIVLSYGYDAAGVRTALQAPFGASVGYAYDAVGRLQTITDEGGARFAFAYDDTDRRTQLTYPNGVSTTYRYDRVGNLIELRGLELLSYRYDQAGNRTAVSRGNERLDYAYDPLDQLIRASRAQEEVASYAYDPVGNRQGDAHRYDPANRLLEDTQFAYAYDAEGNLTQRTRKADGAVTRYHWDAENRLTRVDTPEGVTSFAYDGLGRRITKVNPAGEEHYIYDSDAILFAFRPDGSLLRRYLHGPEIDEPLRVTKDGHDLFLGADALGSVIHAFDAQRQIVERRSYAPFGQWQGAASAEPATPYAFTGREQDSATGLYYYRARYYDPTAGIFLSEDPSRFAAADSNLRRYVFNNPPRIRDPTGEAAPLVGAGVNVLIGYVSARASGHCYSWQDAAKDAALGAVGAGLLVRARVLLNLVRAERLAALPGAGRVLSGLQTGLNRLKIRLTGIPQGIGRREFREAGKLLRSKAGHISDEILVHGSRAGGNARAASDIDFMIRVSPQQFDDLVKARFGTPNIGSAKLDTMQHAIDTGKIQAGEAGLRGTRRALERLLGKEVDLSVVKAGGPFDTGPFIPVP